MRLWMYAIVLRPKDPKACEMILSDIKLTLGRDEDHVRLKVSQGDEIAAYPDRIDEIEIVVRPFC